LTRPSAQLREISLQRSINKSGFQAKDLTGELFDPQYFNAQGRNSSSGSKGEPDGLESTENRRSIGRHGNQHVYVRYPQVSGRTFHHFTQVDFRA
jgi:hypothetical protein